MVLRAASLESDHVWRIALQAVKIFNLKDFKINRIEGVNERIEQVEGETLKLDRA